MNTALIGELVKLRYQLLWAKTRSRNGRIALFLAGYLLLVLVIALLATGGFGAALLAVRSGKAEAIAQGALTALFLAAELASLLRPGTRSRGGALCHGRGKLLVRAGRRPAAVRRQLPAGPRGGPIHRPNDAAQGRGARPDGADHGAGVPALGGGAAAQEEPRDRDCAGAASTVHTTVRRGRRDDSPGSGGHTRTGDRRDLDPGTGRASGVA